MCFVLVTRLSVTIWRAEKGQGSAALQRTGIESSKIRSAPSNAMVAPFLLLSSASVVAAQPPPLASPPAAVQPCDPLATAEVREVLGILASAQQRGRVLTGQVEADSHDDAAGGSKTFTRRDWDTVHGITGQRPAIWGGQFLWGNTTWAAPYRQEMVDWAAQLWLGGGAVGNRSLAHVNFHLCPPTPAFASRACHWSDIEGKGHNPPSLGDAMLTAGSAENVIWLAQLDVMAGYLAQLQRRAVPVLWRPFHEANGGWFWWGQQPRFAELWAQVFERFTQHHGLHNLVWVYGPSGQLPIGPTYPGAGMVDVLGQDTYAKSAGTAADGFTAAAYADLVGTAAGKVVALTEVGLAPGDKVLASQNHSYFLMWGNFETTANTPADLSALYNGPYALNMGDF
jgi:mannan endo-1,4-beta-mannosidase